VCLGRTQWCRSQFFEFGFEFCFELAFQLRRGGSRERTSGWTSDRRRDQWPGHLGDLLQKPVVRRSAGSLVVP
jgi:hypothetical protein